MVREIKFRDYGVKISELRAPFSWSDEGEEVEYYGHHVVIEDADGVPIARVSAPRDEHGRGVIEAAAINAQAIVNALNHAARVAESFAGPATARMPGGTNVTSESEDA